MQYPYISKEFILTTDSLNDGARALLSQGEVYKDLHIVFASCCVNKAEKNCSKVEKELTGIVWGIKHFWTYLCDRKFKEVSDHKLPTWIMNVKDLGPRLLRWHIRLEEYDCEIVYKSGMQNSNTDAFSKIFTLTKGGNEFDELDPDMNIRIFHP
jgi:hypothetical protein